MKKIIVLGASGSIGSQTIDLVREFPDKFELIAISVHENIAVLESLLDEFPSIQKACITSSIEYDNLKVTHDIEEILKLDADLIVNGISGIAGLKPSIRSIELDKTLCIANKETVIIGGDQLIDLLNKHPDAKVIPLDSEHNSLLQLLQGEDIEEVSKLIITASGGPFKDYSKEQLENISVEEAINHPTWNMGKKISVDSATLFNKGLEILEVHYLFGIDFNDIDVVINRKSLVHAMITFVDGTSKLLLSTPDMKLPILYGISNGHRYPNSVDKLDITKLNELKFEQIDEDKFPAVKLAYKVGFLGGNAPLVYCVANEVAVEYFMNNKIKFTEIYNIVEEVVESTTITHHYHLEDIDGMVEDVKNKTKDLIERRTK